MEKISKKTVENYKKWIAAAKPAESIENRAGNVIAELDAIKEILAEIAETEKDGHRKIMLRGLENFLDSATDEVDSITRELLDAETFRAVE